MPEATNGSVFALNFAVTFSLVADSANVARNLLAIRSYIFAFLPSSFFGSMPVGNIAGCAASVFLPLFGLSSPLSNFFVNAEYMPCFDKSDNIFLNPMAGGSCCDEVLGYDMYPEV